MYNPRKRNRPFDAQNDEEIAQNEDMEFKKDIANVHLKETTIPRWNPTENIASDYEDFYKPVGSIELRIDRFTEFARGEMQQKQLLNNLWRWSASTYIRGIPWKLCAILTQIEHSVEPSQHKRFLGLFLYCNKDSTNPTWNCRAKYTFCVVAQKEDVDRYEFSNQHNFCGNENEYGWNRFISINTLLDPENGFIKDDTVILRADVKAKTPRGIQRIQDPRVKTFLSAFGLVPFLVDRPVDKSLLFSSTQLQSNFVLIVQGREVHVQTTFLSMHSQYFKQQFDKDGKVNKAILQNIDYAEFTELLAGNIETVSKLAHIFKMTDLLKQCEVFLMVNSCNFGKVKLLLMAHWYHLEHLQAKCIDEYKSGGNLKQMRKEQEFDVLDCQMKAILLDKFVEDNTSAAASAANCNKASEQRTVPSSGGSNILDRLVSSTSAPSDAVLIVENQRIPIHKMYLSVHSEYFKAMFMFMGEFQKNQVGIVLEEVDYADILELLAVIYPTDSSVTGVFHGYY
ncbi:BTB/POZ domain-containing protein [Ditylenchus destructor]|uniref:BTB/POZ domain-containing protein n=1 Tax=Ditylenchus destructor TaxID=166010 RepID=A0AAD4QRX0_9BILA|nr:BTB/POZ domain-containing protein [Ditylenchus destructor]